MQDNYTEVPINYLAIDSETSGFSSDKNATLQIALIPIIDGKQYEPFVSYVKPHSGAVIDPGALKVNGLTFDQIMNFPEASMVVQNMTKWWSQFNTTFSLLGHNVAFDRKFMYSLFTRNKCHGDFISKITSNDFCTLEESKKAFLKSKSKPVSYKLGDLCKYFNIPLDNAHDALVDIKATYTLYENIRSMTQVPLAFKEDLSYEEKRIRFLDAKYIQFNAGGDIFINSEATKNPEIAKFIGEEIILRYGGV